MIKFDNLQVVSIFGRLINMQLLYQKWFHTSVVLCLFLNFSFGLSEAQEEEKMVKIPDSPPQITITLRSDFTFDQNLEPDPQKHSVEKNQFSGKNKKSIVGQKKPPSSTFKVDKNYQSIERFEMVSPKEIEISFNQNTKLSKKTIRGTVQLKDKSLILAGRGFNIQNFDASSDLPIGLDYTSHLRGQVQHIPTIGTKEHLDPAEEYSKHTKDLIYGETRAAFDKMPQFKVKRDDVEPEVKMPVSVEKSSNSVLVFPPGKESIAIISRDKEPLDLLLGNETLNKKRFRSY